MGRTEELPWPRQRKVLPERSTGMMIAYRSQHVLLEQRPESGIWGGLWSLPEFDAKATPDQACQLLGVMPSETKVLASFVHVFTHYRLTIKPVLACIQPHALATHKESVSIPKAAVRRWVAIEKLPELGLPAPVRKLLFGLLADKVLK